MGFLDQNEQKIRKIRRSFYVRFDQNLDLFDNIYLLTNQPLYNLFIFPFDPRPKIEPAPIQALIDRYSQKDPTFGHTLRKNCA